MNNSGHGGGGESSLTPLLRAQGATLHPDAAAAFSMENAFPPGPLGSAHQPIAMAPQVVCKRCLHPGVDVKLLDCGCSFHARCTPIPESNHLGECPSCHAPVRSLLLMPMNFDEIDAAKEQAASMEPSSKRGKKRKNATLARLNPSASNATTDDTGEGSDLRTGRWTAEETMYSDKLIEQFEAGGLPLTDGIKLNDFLSNMLKSKQSRLTKKMKNAKLSARAYKRASGYIANFEAARDFSAVEAAFCDSISCGLERAEIRFHMQKEWREVFSAFCVAIGQKLNADEWLSSVEEMDRRISRAKDAARMARRKIMMGYALTQDSMNQEQGVFIDKTAGSDGVGENNAMSDPLSPKGLSKKRQGNMASSFRHISSPFVGKVIQYIDRNQLPFEHIDAWVPSFISNGDQPNTLQSDDQQKCRLCFAGFATTRFKIPNDGTRPEPMSSQDQYDLLSFGEYSSKFSFDVGCGLPGRVYSSGVCSWEQGVVNAPSHQFERVGGASQWGIKTVLGIPIPSPNVGRIVVLLYSKYDRPRDHDLVRRTTEELTKLMPTPKWKLVVDVGGAAPPKEDSSGHPTDARVEALLNLIVENTPTHRTSPYSPYLAGFEALRQLLTKADKTLPESEMFRTTLDSFTAYLSSRKKPEEIAWMIARDYMLLSQPQHMSGTTTGSAPPLLVDGALSAASTLMAVPQANAQAQLNSAAYGLGMMAGQNTAAAASLLLRGQHAATLYPNHSASFRSLMNQRAPQEQHDK